MEDTSLVQRFLTIIRMNMGPLFLVGCCVLFVLAFLNEFYLAPVKKIGPTQPIPFSHRIHSGVKEIQCQFCHPYVDRSTYPGIPPVEKCLYCHEYIIPTHPEIQKEHNYFNTKTETPWRQVNYLPEHVLFNHQRHIRKEVACQECHGAVETMDRLKGVRFKMEFCIQCHEEKKANLGCWLACHS